MFQIWGWYKGKVGKVVVGWDRMWHIETGTISSGYRIMLVGTRGTGTPSEEYRVLIPNTGIDHQKYHLKEERVCQKRDLEG